MDIKMMKDYIRDDGKVRNCKSNIAKMNVFEWMYYRRESLKIYTIEAFENLFEGLARVLFAIFNLVVIALFPITFPISAFVNIRNAKKAVELQKKGLL